MGGFILWHHIIWYLLNRGRDGDPGGLEDFPGHPLQRGSEVVPVFPLAHFDFHQGGKVPTDVGPLQLPTAPGQAALQFIQQHQGQKRTEDMPANRRISLMKDRPGLQQRFGGAGGIRWSVHNGRPDAFSLETEIMRQPWLPLSQNGFWGPRCPGKIPQSFFS